MTSTALPLNHSKRRRIAKRNAQVERLRQIAARKRGRRIPGRHRVRDHAFLPSLPANYHAEVRKALAGPLIALAQRPQFILFEARPHADGSLDKVPVAADRSPINAHDPSNWMDASTALASAELMGLGVGWVISETCGIACMDLDDAATPSGAWSDHAQMMQRYFPGAGVELSVSGTGLHVWMSYTGIMPPHGKKNANGEFYSARRFIALGGRAGAIGDARTDHTATLPAFLAYFFPPGVAAAGAQVWNDRNIDPAYDDALIAKALASVSAGSSFGGRASFADLWTNNVPILARAFPDSDPSKVYDYSDADLSLASHLAFWTQRDHERIARIMRRSKLVRDKWKRDDYFEGTIARACEGVRDVYQGERIEPIPPAPGTPVGRAPVAEHLTTDQSNAVRIHRAFGARIMSAGGGQWFAWDGLRWAPDKGGVWECAQQLSRIIGAEAIEWEAKAKQGYATGDQSRGPFEAQQIADALKKHSIKAESREAKNAALGELVDLCAVPIESLDADPWVINTLSGIVDLRDASVRPHDPAARITKVAPVRYEPSAQAPRFEAFLAEIMREDRLPAGQRPLCEFLQRWFGYCATGLVREQRFAVHHGEGANGKSTLLGIIFTVLGGEYAGEAAPGLMTSSNERHPTEIADLRGRRLVTSSESRDDETLREDFIKRATGGDRLKARFMRQDFFEFSPTHKLQLLTNHRPRIVGQDFAIWRRVMLIPYLVTFGTPEQVAAGEAKRVRDSALGAALEAEREGVFAWIVRGAVQWAERGLNPPAAVVAATEEYRFEQDTIGRFVSQCCALGVEKSVPLNGDSVMDPLYPRYVQWCQDNGSKPMGARRLLKELYRLVPGFRTEETTRKSEITMKSRAVTMIFGLE